MVVIQSVICYSISLPPGWDPYMLYDTVGNPGNPDSVFYFSIYPNNFFLLFIYRILLEIFNLLNIQNTWLALAFVNIILIDTTICMLCIYAKRILGLRFAGQVFVISALLFGLFPWIVIFYSDTILMFFIVAVLLFHNLSGTAKILAKKVIYSILAGAFLAAGILVKPTCIIIYLALFIVDLLRTDKGRLLLRRLFFSGVSIFAAAVIFFSFNLYKSKQKFIQTTPGIAIPWAHFLMMGLYEFRGEDGKTLLYGTWNIEDVAFTGKKPSTEEKTAAALQVYFERVRERGLGKTLVFYFDKMRWFTSDGTFWWGQEGGFLDYAQAKDNILTQFFYSKGENYSLFKYYSQGLWLSVWLGAFFSIHLRKKIAAEKDVEVWQLAIIGILLFTTLFEGRSRYLIPYLPLFSLLASAGLLKANAIISGKFLSSTGGHLLRKNKAVL